jgi:alpha-galactosidase
VVEVPASVDAHGVVAHRAEPLPPQCAALNRRYLDVCDLAVRAALEGSRGHVHHAALLDPNVSATMPPDRIAAMVDELLDAHQAAGRLPEALCR